MIPDFFRKERSTVVGNSVVCVCHTSICFCISGAHARAALLLGSIYFGASETSPCCHKGSALAKEAAYETRQHLLMCGRYRYLLHFRLQTALTLQRIARSPVS